MTVSRRDFLSTCAAAIGAGRLARAANADSPLVQTVLGGVPAETLGPTLMHEHLLVDFIGAASVSRDRYEADAVVARMLPFLEQLRAEGGRTLVDATPAWIGRDPALLRRLSDASGIAIVTTTGYYGAANDKFLPPHAWTETAEQLAARWVAEARDGIDGTGIRPGIIKIGVDTGPLSEVDAKLVRAAGLVQRATGLPIASHTTDGVAAVAEIDLLEQLGLPLDGFIWVHAHAEKDRAVHRHVAERGAWVEFDGISESTADEHVSLVLEMRARHLLHRTLVSHDAGWYHVGETNGGDVRPYTLLFERVLPALRTSGFTAAEKKQLIVDNPRTALVRPTTIAPVRGSSPPRRYDR
jgi:phosphotriesterase-related protein